MIFFLISHQNHIVLIPHLNHFIQMVHMRDHNINFYEEIHATTRALLSGAIYARWGFLYERKHYTI